MMFMGELRRRVSELALIALALATTWGIQSGRLGNAATEAFEYFVRDLVQYSFSSSGEETRIAVVDIHEDSIQKLGPWPWPRERLAELSQTLLNRHGAALVVMDMVFPDPRDAQGDAELKKLGLEGRVVFSEVFDYNLRQEPVLSGQASLGLSPLAFAPLERPFDIAGPQSNFENRERPHLKASGFMGNHKDLAQAPCIGNIGFIPDFDGQVRRLPMLTEWQGRIYPGLSLSSLLCLNAIDPEELARIPPVWPLRFRQRDTGWLTVSALDILREQPVPSLKGRIVIVGSSALGLSDRVATPLSNSISGVYVHAQALSELLDLKNLNRPPSPAQALTLQLLIVLGAALTVLSSRKLRWLLVYGGLLTAFWLGLSAWQALTVSPNPVTSAFWGGLILLTLLMPLEWFHDRRAARTSLALLSRYVAPSVLKELMQKAPEDNPLAPRSREVTALVADMADYSVITRSLPLQDAAFVTRSFLEALTVPVWTYRGTLDRYSGDGLVAFWGAPLDQPDQTDLAVDAAKAMKKAVEELNERLAARLLPKVEVRIGIARSQALVGDFGTRYRAAYTAVGNCINFAARLESLAKEIRESILISHEASQQVQRHSLSPLPPVQVKGFGEVVVYRP
jgi:adenylate cyclase